MRLVLIISLCITLLLTAGVHAQETCREGDRRECGLIEGVCEPGRSICKDGKWVECKGSVGPSETDICGNRVDDNCDGTIDENCFPWVSLVFVGMGILFIGVGLYYMQRERGERFIPESLGKD